jgi:hypothetical protein
VLDGRLRRDATPDGELRSVRRVADAHVVRRQVAIVVVAVICGIVLASVIGALALAEREFVMFCHPYPEQCHTPRTWILGLYVTRMQILVGSGVLGGLVGALFGILLAPASRARSDAAK